MIFNFINKKQDGSVAAGTLVHTKEGLVPIEKIKVGDWVLSQPEAKGELTYKNVLKTFDHYDTPVISLFYYVCRDGVWEDERLIITENRSFWVKGYDPEIYANDPDWDDSMVTVGWTKATGLEYGFLLELASGEVARVSSVEELWRTREEGVCWATNNRNDDVGTLVRFGEGGVISESDCGESDYSDEEDFYDRKDDPVAYDKYVYRCVVYNLKIEDSHTYYVGTYGARVHDAN